MHSTSPVRLLTRAVVGLALVLAVGTAPRAARAQDLAPPTAATSAPSGGSASAAAATSFGVAGAWVVSVQSYNAGSPTPSFFFEKQASGGSSLLIQPGLDYFIGNGISVGGVVGLGFSSGSPNTTAVKLGARRIQPGADRARHLLADCRDRWLVHPQQHVEQHGGAGGLRAVFVSRRAALLPRRRPVPELPGEGR